MKFDNAASPVFIETQVMGRRWWWLALIIAALGLLPSLLMAEKATLWVRSGPALIGIAAGSLVWLMRLETRIDEVGIHYRYLPLLNRWRHWPWADFRQVKPRTYSPLGDFGGWGIRGFPGNLAYNVWGSHGLQLVFQSGDRLLLGTQRPEELAATLQALGQLPG
ncbi:hypothetical protein GCM10028822_17780 [Hymenobacter terrigena]